MSRYSSHRRMLAYLLAGVVWTTPSPLELHVAFTFFIFSFFELTAWINILHAEKLDNEEPEPPKGQVVSLPNMAIRQDEIV